MTALLIVERDFMIYHVGIRRVTFYYINKLVDLGYDIDLATPDGTGRLLRCDPAVTELVILAARRDARGTGSRGMNEPSWTSDNPVLIETAPQATLAVEWTGEFVEPTDYAISIITNPWICHNDSLPECPYTMGIVPNLIPNLLAAGALHFGTYNDVYGFARDHNTGYAFFCRHVENIVCISESTRHDFLQFYGTSPIRGQVVVDIPFRLNTGIENHQKTENDPFHILLVNALDPCKNLRNIVASLSALSGTASFVLSIVGREKMPQHLAMAALNQLDQRGIHIRWYRDASALRLSQLYRDADLLFFPSLYEGLGLPILEAQAHGLPALSSDISSCPEINMNAGLIAPPIDIALMTAKLAAVIRGEIAPLAGDDLRRALQTMLTHKQSELVIPAAR